MSNEKSEKAEVDLWKSLMRPPGESRTPRIWSKANLVRLFLKTPTPVIADAMDGRNVLSCLRPVLSRAAIAGPVVTVKTNPTDWGTVVSAIEEASPGDVLFIDSSGSNVAVWGGLTSRAAQQRGLVGTIIYGSCRDIPTIETLQYPVWVKGITARAGRPLNKGKVNVPINVRGLSVQPRDLAIADVHGAVIVPSNEATVVANRITEIISKERLIETGIKRGRSLSELLWDFSP
ncbi:MAG: RraA family protein [Halobacteriota archaeon]